MSLPLLDALAAVAPVTPCVTSAPDTCGAAKKEHRRQEGEEYFQGEKAMVNSFPKTVKEESKIKKLEQSSKLLVGVNCEIG